MDLPSELPSKPNFGENQGDRNTRIPEQNFHVNDYIFSAAQIQLMSGQPVYSDQHFHGSNSGGGSSPNLISSEQDLLGTNQTSTEAQAEQMMMRQQQSSQHQPADMFSVDSSEQNHHPVNKHTVAETVQMRTQQQSGQHQLPDMPTADSAAEQVKKKRKRKEADQKYREKQKKQREAMELKVTTLEAEKEQLKAETKSQKEQLDLVNQRCETKEKELDKKQMELDKLGEDFVELKKQYEKEHESNKILTDKYIKILEVVNGLGTPSNELGQQHGQTTNLSSQWDYGSSGIDSIGSIMAQLGGAL